MSIITLYHGTPNEFVTPQYGYGEDKHDYGKGFYLTENIELAKEWAVCRPTETNGWVHKYELDISDLKILDFQKYDVLSWLAELMKHRDAADTKRYKVLSIIVSRSHCAIIANIPTNKRPLAELISMLSITATKLHL